MRIFGLSPEERLRRALLRAGCASVQIADGPAPPLDGGGSDEVVLFRGDTLFDERLVAAVVETPGAALTAPEGDAIDAGEPVAAHVPHAEAAAAAEWLRAPTTAPAPAGVTARSPESLAPAYTAQLRKFDPPWVVRARRGAERAVEARLFASAYKGITDLVTKWVWPVPALAATRMLARHRVHPNTVTLISWGLTLAAMQAFFSGAFGLGLLAAWGMTFLDTVDGKLARVTLTSSRVGHVLDHGLDIIHPPFWYLAWGLGLGPGHEFATAVVVGGYVVGRLMEGVFLWAFGIETHSWRPLDSMFRTITARRNPNLILLMVGALGGRPDLGLVMVALWTAVSLGFHGVRMLQAFAARRRGETIQPWHGAVPAPPTEASGVSQDRPS